MPFDVKKYVDDLFSDKKHAKKVKKIRKKGKKSGNKKKALKKQFKYLNKAKNGKKKPMSKRAIHMVDHLNQKTVNHVWKKTKNVSNAYRVMQRLDRIEKILTGNKEIPQNSNNNNNSNIHTIHDYKN